ncbi:MAG: hypothetical protein RLY43_142 [Bacteroidota bacterium]
MYNISEFFIKLIGVKFYFGLYEIFMSFPFYFFRIFSIKNNKIVLCNFDGKGYGDNPKYIAEELIKNNRNLDIVWLVENINNHDFPDYIRSVNIRSIKAIFELVTSKVWVDNSRKSFVTRKRNKQFYIQTWHGCMMIKKIEQDAQSKLPYLYVKSAINDSRMINLCISNSRFMTNFMKSSFWYNGNILQCGYPKSDCLINSSDLDTCNIKNKFNIDEKLKIVLYAPTFRNSKKLDSYLLEFEELLNTLNLKFGGSWIILLRLHPFMSEMSKKFNFSKKVIDVSDYNDMQDLLIISDILITDYSSTMFEFYLMNKPVFLYASDVEFYKNERGLYFEIEELPFPKSNSYDGLLKNIVNFDKDTYFDQVNKFMDIIDFQEKGKASQIIVSEINKVIN